MAASDPKVAAQDAYFAAQNLPLYLAVSAKPGPDNYFDWPPSMNENDPSSRR
jgi:hypothetical protein